MMDPKQMREAAKTPTSCPLDGPCGCPTCGVTALLLQGRLRQHGWSLTDIKRVHLQGSPLAGGTPYIASVRVDGREVYRIERRPDEVFQPAVFDDIQRSLRRPM